MKMSYILFMYLFLRDTLTWQGGRRTCERFIKPAIPPSTAMAPSSSMSLVGSHITPPPNAVSPSPMDVAKS
jgi:hypothetical protein